MYFMGKKIHITLACRILFNILKCKMGVKKSLLAVDMPKGSYNTPSKAYKNAKINYD